MYIGHGAELAYVFHTYEGLYSHAEKELADTVSMYWGDFVRDGKPTDGNNCDSCNADQDCTKKVK